MGSKELGLPCLDSPINTCTSLRARAFVGHALLRNEISMLEIGHAICTLSRLTAWI